MTQFGAKRMCYETKRLQASHLEVMKLRLTFAANIKDLGTPMFVKMLEPG